MGEVIDPKKDDKKPDAPAGGIDAPWGSTGFIVGATLLLMFIATRFAGLGNGGFSWAQIISYIPENVFNAARQIIISYTIFATLLSLFFLIGMVYSLIRLFEVERVWWNNLYPVPAQPELQTKQNTKWERVLQHVGSDNPSDWRLAILEADIILDELLDNLGYIGDTVGDKLKRVNRGDFETLDQAWEAHKIRNAIAHEGGDFQLSQREAQRVIGLFQAVFQEFEYI